MEDYPAMTCGRFAACSDVPSYRSVAERARERGSRICGDNREWRRLLTELVNGELDMEAEGMRARRVVEQYYSAEVVARGDAAYMREIRSQ